MKLIERLSLIKAGYTKKEIAEIEAAEQEPEQEPEPKEVSEEQPEQEPEPDYKELYEKAKADLEAAQRANQQQQVPDSDSVDYEKEVADLINEIL